ncbi:MAG: hypothetical protein J6Y37_12625 [Paludibacteraceae bacterium]|nr:hypothetical protein [Paludibacteraceae bacterium]
MKQKGVFLLRFFLLSIVLLNTWQCKSNVKGFSKDGCGIDVLRDSSKMSLCILDSFKLKYGNLSPFCRTQLVDYVLDSIMMNNNPSPYLYEGCVIFLVDYVPSCDYTFSQKEKIVNVLKRKYDYGLGSLFLKFRDTAFSTQFRWILENQSLDKFASFQVERILFLQNEKKVMAKWNQKLEELKVGGDVMPEEYGLMISDIIEEGRSLWPELCSILKTHPRKYIFTNYSYKDELEYEELLLFVMEKLKRDGRIDVDLSECVYRLVGDGYVYYKLSDKRIPELLKELENRVFY